jgi:hypothetical protein
MVSLFSAESQQTGLEASRQQSTILFFWLFFGLELEFFLRSGNLKGWGVFLGGFFVLSLAGIDLGSLSKILRNSFIYFTPLFISC